jgi:hypothetical protein
MHKILTWNTRHDGSRKTSAIVDALLMYSEFEIDETRLNTRCGFNFHLRH